MQIGNQLRGEINNVICYYSAYKISQIFNNLILMNKKKILNSIRTLL